MSCFRLSVSPFGSCNSLKLSLDLCFENFQGFLFNQRSLIWNTDARRLVLNLFSGLPRCKNLWHFFFVLLARSGVWLLFNGLWTLLFSLFYVIREFDKFLHRGWAESGCVAYSSMTVSRYHDTVPLTCRRVIRNSYNRNELHTRTLRRLPLHSSYFCVMKAS